MRIRSYKQDQQFRVWVNTIDFTATAAQIRSGVGEISQCNSATLRALNALEFIRSCVGQSASRCITGVWEGLDVRLEAA